jgi:hypothetical protein
MRRRERVCTTRPEPLIIANGHVIDAFNVGQMYSLFAEVIRTMN